MVAVIGTVAVRRDDRAPQDLVTGTELRIVSWPRNRSEATT